MKNEINIVFASNDKMAMPLGVVISGVLDNIKSGKRVRLHVLSFAMSDDCEARLRRIVTSRRPGHDDQLIIHRLSDDRFASLPEVRHLTRETYLRLAIPDLLKDVDRVLYLDADLLVTADVAELYQLEMAGAPAAAVATANVRSLSSPDGIDYACEMDGIDPNAPYVNAGVLLFDLEVWRRERLADACFDFLQRHAERLHCADQDALNGVLAGRIHLLPPQWNVMSFKDAELDSLPDQEVAAVIRQINTDPGSVPHIRHFTGQFKPWSDRSLRHGMQRKYYSALVRSGWFASGIDAMCWRVGWYGRNLRKIVGAGFGTRP